jgi:hypothetical protein
MQTKGVVSGLVIPITLTLLGGLATVPPAFAQASFTVVPFDFDPHGTRLVEAEWEDGIGCPTNANTAPFLPPNFDTVGTGSYTDPACPNGDPNDKRNYGLLLVKTGPTNNDASAGAVIQGVQGTALRELGYDLRKPGPPLPPNVNPTPFPGNPNDPRGSHCGAGAPRFNIVITEDPGAIYFLACNSPAPDMDNSGLGGGWQRLRWGGTAPLMAFRNGVTPTDISGQHVKTLSIVFDEGQDTGPDNFGLAVLDNIDVNGTLVGRGPEKPKEKDRDESEGEDRDHRHHHAENSSSRPESSRLSYEDPSQGVKIQMVNGARGITYNGACVSFVGDALMNKEPGYVVSFATCDLSALSTPLTPSIGAFTIAVTGASGVVYQRSGELTSGHVSIHPR